jgi:hypothetical protein
VPNQFSFWLMSLVTGKAATLNGVARSTER